MDCNILNIWNLDVKGFRNEVYVTELRDDCESIIIYLKVKDDDSKFLKISFEDALSYRNTNESFMLKIWNETPNEKLGKIFYTVEKSNYIDFFDEMTLGLYKDWNIVHYAIYTDKHCIDILSIIKPKIEWINSP